MTTVYKIFDIKTVEKRENGGRIRISTANFDREFDRVYPRGGKFGNYYNNPVVQYGHNYRDPWATIGKTNELIITDEYIEADFDLRPAANDNDPQSIVLLLWNGNWIKAASIGFTPDHESDANKRNEKGGIDFHAWELLEWSLVSLPMNQEALRQGFEKLFKSLDDQEYGDPSDPMGREPGDVDDAGDPGEPEANTEPESNDDPTSHDENEGEEEALAALSTLLETLEELYNG